MNIVDTIKGPLMSGDTLGRLGSMIGADPAAVQKAVSGGIPAILSGLAGTASTSDGAQRLLGALGKADAGILGKIGSLAGGGGAAVADQGTNLLNSLLGGATLSGIVAALSRYSGIGMDGVKKLLGFLAPMIMGAIASHFRGSAPSAASLSSFFAEQKSNIASALPSGLSLDNIPGLAAVGTGARNVAGATRSAASGAATAAAGAGSNLLLPLLLLLLAAVAVWYFFLKPKADVPATQPAITSPPDVGSFAKGLTEKYDKLTDMLGGIKDAASAEAALPKLKEYNSDLDNTKALWDKIPESGRSTIKTVTSEHLGKLKDMIAKLLEIPGVGDKIKPVVEEIVNKLSAFGG
jgi:Bacterial protein of unknown function (DUF937)